MELLDLSKNENPLGCSPLAVSNAIEALHTIHRYHSEQAFAEAVAAMHEVEASTVFVANGASEIIDLIARTKLSPGSNAVTTRGSFAAYNTVTHNAGAAIITPNKQDSSCTLQDLQETVTSRTRVVWLSNPNNPTGSLLSPQNIVEFASNNQDVTVVCDEAYIDYVDNAKEASTLSTLPNMPPNIIVIKSFSKLHGIAGTRIGYAVASPENVATLKRLQMPFSVSSVAVAAATGALQDKPFQQLSRETAVASRHIIQAVLECLCIEFLPSVCNFVSFAAQNAAQQCSSLEQKGILVRELTDFGMPNHIRVSTGTLQQTQRFAETFHKIATQVKKEHA